MINEICSIGMGFSPFIKAITIHPALAKIWRRDGCWKNKPST
ncbi:hypothetical protein ADICYQ_1725 [Cyclobacterium qasimii M12-11B]|uniref:Uncharacterized protein n=1 Tax=Cyclobacterium qasimii M12-11B TaxID=641524 RepID=S7VGB5_9BACT|nr:hypothetical protein ADICYQ_1725 [Cyclobacterium qasimii M12-11B]